MKWIVKVHGSEDHGEVQSQYGALHFTAETAQALFQRRQAFRAAKAADATLYRLTYWDSTVCWFGRPTAIRADGPYPAAWQVDDYGDPAEAFLRQVLDEPSLRELNAGAGPQVVPAKFEVPECLRDATECDLLDVLDDGILFKSYPKHCDCQQGTDHIPWALVERAAQANAPASAAVPMLSPIHLPATGSPLT